VDFVGLGDACVCEGIDALVGRVRDRADALDVVVHVRTKGERLDGGAGLLGEESHGVGPSLAHSTGLGRGETTAGSAASHAVGDSVGELVYDDVVLEGTIPVGGVEGPGVHAALSSLAVGGSSKVGVVGSSRVLDREQDGITALSALCAVVGLEVVGGLGEAVTVGEIVDGVADVEGVGARSVDVDSDAGGLCRIESVVKGEVGTASLGRRCLPGLVSLDVVALGLAVGGRADLMPSVRAGDLVCRIGDELEALGGEVLLVERDNAVLEKELEGELYNLQRRRLTAASATKSTTSMTLPLWASTDA
jgi:hypothetical protein